MLYKYTFLVTAAAIACLAPATAQNQKEKKKKKPKKIKAEKTVRTHPLLSLESIELDGLDLLQVGGMCFHGESLYVVTFSPDRTDNNPDHNGKLIRVDNLAGRGKPKLTILCEGLYEPAGVGVVGKSIYVGTKDQILRFTDATSTVNFHTYTIGFESYKKDGKEYLCGNFTTAIKLGGKRDYMVPPNKDVHRGSTFILGPVTGKEAPEDISFKYLAGGFRTPNGFQPKDVIAETGDVTKMTPPTLHLPQGGVARSPAQPHVIRGRKGVLARYNGQILLCDFTSGQILRASLEEVDGIWQGVVFKHTSGAADENGNNGFTAAPNRLVEGPDGNYYIGQIGAGRLWEFNGKQAGLQRFKVASKSDVPADFNEILDVKAIEGGFELEFIRPLDKNSIKAKDVSVLQWTYHPKSSYGGPQVASERIVATSLDFDRSGKKATLIINGLKDGSDIVGEGAKTNENSGWVIRVGFNPKKRGKPLLHTKEFWYTMHKRVGQKTKAEKINISKFEQVEMKFKSLCMACHRELDNGWGAPNLKGILGREQTVIRGGKKEKVKIDEAYLINAIVNPDSEKPIEFKNAVMANPGLNAKQAKEMVDYIKSL